MDQSDIFFSASIKMVEKVPHLLTNISVDAIDALNRLSEAAAELAHLKRKCTIKHYFHMIKMI